ncbi:MAG: hypothetical protein ACTSPW_18860 [Promethearchaeota archaeon]
MEWILLIISFGLGIGLNYLIDRELDIFQSLLLSELSFFIITGSIKINFIYTAIFLVILTLIIVYYVYKRVKK